MFENDLLDVLWQFTKQKISQPEFCAQLARLSIPEKHLAPKILLEILLLMKSNSCVRARYFFAKLMVLQFSQYPDKSLWRSILFRSDVVGSLLTVDILSLLLKLKDPPEIVEAASDIFSDLNVGDLLADENSTSTDYDLICQKFEILEQIFDSEKVFGQKEKLFESILINWKTVIRAIIDGLFTQNCAVQRKIMSFLTEFSRILLHRICLKEASQVIFSLSSKAAELSKVVGQCELCKKIHWFGSSHLEKQEKESGSHLYRQKVLVTLQSVSMSILTDASGVDTCVELLSKVHYLYPSLGDLVDAFVGHDEYLMDLVLTSCIIWPKIQQSEVSNYFSAHLIWLHIMKKIDWDESVILDWLTSEKSALLMLLYYLKFARNYFAEFVEAANSANFVEGQEVQQMNSEENTVFELCTEEHKMTIKVIEDLGCASHQRNVELFPAASFKRKSLEGKAASRASSVVQAESVTVERKTVDLFVRLKVKLERLHDADVLGFNPKSVVRLIESFEVLAS